LPADEGIALAVHDDRRLSDQRQPLFHAVFQRRARRRAELAKVVADAVPGRERHQRYRLPRRLAQPGEDLTPPAPSRRVDRWSGEHHRADSVGRPHRELGDDLTAHRIGDERRPLEPELVEPGMQRIGVLADAGSVARTVAAAVAGEIRDVRRAVDGENPRQRHEVAPRDAVAVQEHDRRPVSADARVDGDTTDVIEAAFEARKRRSLSHDTSLPHGK